MAGALVVLGLPVPPTRRTVAAEPYRCSCVEIGI